MSSSPPVSSSSSVRSSRRRKKERLHKDARIAIIGSGLGGLGAAISLELAGFRNVTLYERDESASCRREGYGLTLSYNPKGPLAHMGILEQVASQDCPSRSHYIFAPDGSILGYYGNAFLSNRGQGQRGNLRVPRQVLLQILRDRVASPIQYGKRIVSFQHEIEQDGTIRMEFEDGSIINKYGRCVIEGTPTISRSYDNSRDCRY